jgi:hypothetical protein
MQYVGQPRWYNKYDFKRIQNPVWGPGGTTGDIVVYSVDDQYRWPTVLSKTRKFTGGSCSQTSLRSTPEHVLLRLVCELEPREHKRAKLVFAESLERQGLILTRKHRDHDVTVDWLKDTVHIEKSACLASSDVDSLSLTVEDAPRFSLPGSYYPYPSWDHSLTNNNSLAVNIGNETFAMRQSKLELNRDSSH